jgi:extradiol dioxygenase family protein
MNTNMNGRDCPSFHLSLPVPSVAESVEFFTDVLGATVSHRSAVGYVNVDWYGVQITLSEGELPKNLASLHFGVNLDLEAFTRVSERILSAPVVDVVSTPQVVDAGTEMERRKMYVRCPAGYLIEIKGYR